jgi:hypothetical protein
MVARTDKGTSSTYSTQRVPFSPRTDNGDPRVRDPVKHVAQHRPVVQRERKVLHRLQQGPAVPPKCEKAACDHTNGEVEVSQNLDTTNPIDWQNLSHTTATSLAAHSAYHQHHQQSHRNVLEVKSDIQRPRSSLQHPSKRQSHQPVALRFEKPFLKKRFSKWTVEREATGSASYAPEQ